MTRIGSILGTLTFLGLAPGTVAGLVPWWMTGWHRSADQMPEGAIATTLGVVLIALGTGVLLESFARFALVGRGTPAPALPTRNLVVTGLYRHVRNPMYLAVVALVIGQGLLFAHVNLLIYGACLWLVFHNFVVIYEEPTLRRAFPEGYERYVATVSRWRPRLHA